MSWAVFWNILFNNLYSFLFCFVIIFITLFLIFRKNFFNLLDPMILMLINISSCLTIILYLLLYEKRSSKNELIIILMTNIIFLITLKIKLFKKNINIGKKLSKKNFKIYYLAHTALFIITSILFIKLIGTKLVTSKLTAFEGIGWLSYLKNFIFPSQLILLFIKRELYNIKRRRDYILFLGIILLYIFSGSKVGIVNLILLISSILFYINNVKKIYLYFKFKKNIIKILFIAILGIILGFSLNGTEKIISKIVNRVFSTGDIYYMLYLNNNIDKILGVRILDYYIISMFKPILKHLIEIKDNMGIGFQVIEAVYNIQTNKFGPNTRYDVVWQLNLGWFGILGGYLSATIIAFLRRIRTKNFYILNLLLFLIINLDFILTDFTLFGSSLFSILLCFIPLIITSELVYKVTGE